jgi:cell division protein ZipA
MSPRELIIFLLGLAIVAVILRGLYVAMQARRGQIKLAIDKNIPQDVDLEAIELSELPGGGARVVERSLEAVVSQNSAIEAANARAASLGLGGEEAGAESIPVLMDTVELKEEIRPRAHTEPQFDARAEMPQDEYEDEEISEGRFDERRDVDSFSADRTSSYEDPDDVLFDYGDEENQTPAAATANDADADEMEEAEEIEEIDVRRTYAGDGMSSVMPDYPEDDWGDDDEEEEDEIPDGFQEEEFGASSYSDEQNEWQEEEFEDDDAIIAAFKGRQAVSSNTPEPDFEEDEYAYLDIEDEESEENSEVEVYEESEADDRTEPTLGGSFEDSLDEFSMSAGERIGYQAAAAEENQQPELFDQAAEPDESQQAESAKPSKAKSGFRSLISAFGRSKEEATETDDRAVEDIPVEPEIADKLDEVSHDEIEYYDDFEESKVSNFEDAVASSSSMQTEGAAPREAQAEQDSMQQSEVLVVNVMARDNRTFEGHDLLQVLITSGLKFGEMNIFHHRLHNENTGPVIFSVANILNPGTFDLNQMDSFSTIGISLFLALPTHINNLQAFEQMLEVAQQVRGALDGELKDDHRNVMTAQTIEHYRQRVRDFELRQLRAAGSRA